MIEIERKFLVTHWPERMGFIASRLYKIRQAYLPAGKGVTTRVRTREILRDQTGKLPPKEAFLTIKGPSKGIARAEYEYPIPCIDAEEMMSLRESNVVEKIRHEIKVGDHVWEVDRFLGDNEGLIVAEIELSAEDEVFVKPEWLGDEVTQNKRYSNSNLAKAPFKYWSAK